jgi:hypothetical protein
MLGRIIGIGDEKDLVVMLVVPELDRLFPSELPNEVRDALWAAGVRALELDDDLPVTMVQQAIAARLDSTDAETRGAAIDLSALVTAICVWVNYQRAEGMWRWYWDKIVPAGGGLQSATFQVKIYIGALRVGGSCMLAGNESIALRVASDLRDGGVDLDQAESFCRQPAVVFKEGLLSDRYGRYLGADAEDSLASFARFARDVTRSVSSGAQPASAPP